MQEHNEMSAITNPVKYLVGGAGTAELFVVDELRYRRIVTTHVTRWFLGSEFDRPVRTVQPIKQ